MCGWFQVEGGWGHTTTLLRIQTKTKGQVFPNRLLETLVYQLENHPFFGLVFERMVPFLIPSLRPPLWPRALIPILPSSVLATPRDVLGSGALIHIRIRPHERPLTMVPTCSAATAL